MPRIGIYTYNCTAHFTFILQLSEVFVYINAIAIPTMQKLQLKNCFLIESFPCKNLSAIAARFRLIAPSIATRWSRSRVIAIAARWSRSRRDDCDRGAIMVIAARLWWSRRDISDRDGIEVNRACNSDAMIAIAAWWSRSRRGDRDRGEVIAISARWSWLREDDRDWGAILKSRISDPKVRIASLAIKSRSQRSYNDLSPMIMIEGRRCDRGAIQKN